MVAQSSAPSPPCIKSMVWFSEPSSNSGNFMVEACIVSPLHNSLACDKQAATASERTKPSSPSRWKIRITHMSISKCSHHSSTINSSVLPRWDTTAQDCASTIFMRLKETEKLMRQETRRECTLGALTLQARSNSGTVPLPHISLGPTGS